MHKILLITENLGSGGAERQLCGLAVLLTQAGYPCRVITYARNQFYEPYLIQNGVDYNFMPELLNKKHRVFRVAKYIRQYKPDIIISYLTSVNITMCLAKLFYKAKLIVSERNNNISITLRDKLKFCLYGVAEAVVANSACHADFIQKHFPSLKKKTFSIINFVDTVRFSPAMKEPARRILRIITVARYTGQKNVLNYLDAVKAIKEKGLPVHFDWYGDRNHHPGYYNMVEKRYKSLDISDYLTLHGTSEAIEDEYRKSDVLCLPSYYEGYPNVIAEAMSCELPVLCSNVFENPYIVENNINGYLFDPNRPEEIVDAVNKVLCLSQDERRSMGKRNRELCLQRNSKEAFLNSYVKLIDTL